MSFPLSTTSVSLKRSLNLALNLSFLSPSILHPQPSLTSLNLSNVHTNLTIRYPQSHSKHESHGFKENQARRLTFSGDSTDMKSSYLPPFAKFFTPSPEDQGFSGSNFRLDKFRVFPPPRFFVPLSSDSLPLLCPAVRVFDLVFCGP